MSPRALVTGSSGGIGSTVMGALAGDDIECIGVDRVPPPAGSTTRFERCDLADLDEIDRLCSALVAETRPLDYLVLCAGIAQHRWLHEEDRRDWLTILQVNLVAPMALVAGLLPVLADGGSIVLFGSGLVLKGLPGQTGYTAAKAGLIGFARSLASELGPRGIRVNTVSPGLTATPMMDPAMEQWNIESRAIKRRQVPEDLVGAVRFFLSPASAFVTGQHLVVDGGSVRH